MRFLQPLSCLLEPSWQPWPLLLQPWASHLAAWGVPVRPLGRSWAALVASSGCFAQPLPPLRRCSRLLGRFRDPPTPQLAPFLFDFPLILARFPSIWNRILALFFRMLVVNVFAAKPLEFISLHVLSLITSTFAARRNARSV